MNETKRKATILLRRFDRMRAELATLEREASRACAEYGLAIGLRGFTKDHLRAQLVREQQQAKRVLGVISNGD